MCSGRVDLSFVLRAFRNGMDGVFVGGCHFNECHYLTDGNFHALQTILMGKKLLAHLGLSPERLRIEEMSAGEGLRFAEIMNDFAGTLKDLGPVGLGEGMERDVLDRKLAAAAQLVPYLRLVERERLRVPTQTEAAYRALYEGDELDRLFQDLVAGKLATGQILLLLGEGPRSTGELSAQLGLTPSEITRYVRSSTRQGLVRYDVDQRRYALV